MLTASSIRHFIFAEMVNLDQMYIRGQKTTHISSNKQTKTFLLLLSGNSIFPSTLFIYHCVECSVWCYYVEIQISVLHYIWFPPNAELILRRTEKGHDTGHRNINGFLNSYFWYINNRVWLCVSQQKMCQRAQPWNEWEIEYTGGSI